MVEKPPLGEAYLSHFGKKGMKWGVRKKRPDEAERKKFFQNPENRRKLVVGAAVVGGALAVSLLMSKSGRTRVTDVAVTNYVQQRQARITAGKNPFGKLAQQFRDVKAASVPSPNEMVANARMAGVRNAVNREGAQRLTDKAWRDQARLASLRRDMDTSTNSLLGGNAQKLAESARQRLASL